MTNQLSGAIMVSERKRKTSTTKEIKTMNKTYIWYGEFNKNGIKSMVVNNEDLDTVLYELDCQDATIILLQRL